MTRREVLTNLICAYIQTNHGLPKMDEDGNLNSSWVHLTDAICRIQSEENPIKEDLTYKKTSEKCELCVRATCTGCDERAQVKQLEHYGY